MITSLLEIYTIKLFVSNNRGNYFLFLFQIHHISTNNLGGNIIEKFVIFVALFASIFTANFIIKKNGLSKDSAYTVLFYFIFLLFFLRF